MDAFRTKLAEHGVGGYGLNVIAAPAAYDDAPDLIEGLTAAIVEGYRGGCADRPAATLGLPGPVSRAGCTVRRGELGAGVRPPGRRDRKPHRRRRADHHPISTTTPGLLAPAPVDRGGPRAPPPASDNLRRVRT